MKTTAIPLALIVCLSTGCATGRTYAPNSHSPGGGGASPTPIPDTTPNLGAPAESLDSQPGSSSYGPGGGGSNGGSGPKLGMPEAWRKSPWSRPGRTASRWQPSGQSAQTSRYRPDAKATNVAPAARRSLLDEPAWSRVERSADQRPIETLELGKGARRVVVLGSMHGDEIQSVALMEELARFLTKNPDALLDTTVLLVKAPNPDGIEGHSPFNIHGVDLNRNFPAPNWQDLPKGRAGSRAASEPETKAIVRLLGEFHPDLIVHLKDSRDKGLINFEGRVRDRAEKAARLIGCQAVTGLALKTSGSMEHYANTSLRCPTITVLLARDENDQLAWSHNREALLSLAGAEDADLYGDGGRSGDKFETSSLRKNPRAKSSPSDPTFGDRNIAKQRTRRPASDPDFPAPVPEQGYLELPPP